MGYIYKIINDINNKVYVGKTSFSVQKRFLEHINDSKKDIHGNRPLYRAMRKYGIEHFHYEVIEETDELDNREKYWIQHLNSFHFGYNATLGGDGSVYLDHKKIFNDFLNFKSISKTAKKNNCSVSTVSEIIRSMNYTLTKKEVYAANNPSKHVRCFDLHGRFVFETNTFLGAASWLHEHGILNGHLKQASSHISDACKGKRKTAYGYIWTCY